MLILRGPDDTAVWTGSRMRPVCTHVGSLDRGGDHFPGGKLGKRKFLDDRTDDDRVESFSLRGL